MRNILSKFMAVGVMLLALFGCKKELPYLVISPTDDIVFSAAATETFTIQVATNIEVWKVSSSQEWCKVSSSVVPTTDKPVPVTSFIVNALENKTMKSPEEAIITVSAEGVPSVTLKVRQNAANAFLKTSPSGNIKYTSQGGETSVSVSTNLPEWSVASNKEWCKVTKTDNEKFNIVAAKNTIAVAKEQATITVSANGASPVTFKVDQSAADAVLTLTPGDNIKYPFRGGTTVITVATNYPVWSVASNKSWCKVTKGEGIFTISVGLNSSMTAPEPATITVKAGEVKSATITVSQDPATELGTESNPFLITNAAEFYAFASNFNADPTKYNNKYLKLSSSIDISEYCTSAEGWKMIGNGGVAFNGHLDGGGNTISGFAIKKNENNNVGLFCSVGASGSIRNLTVSGSIDLPFSSKERSVGGICGINLGKIINCHNRVNITVEAYSVGGVAGTSASTSVSEPSMVGCTNSGIIINLWKGTGNPSSDYTPSLSGGIVGSSSNIIEGCSNNGEVRGYVYVAGVAAQSSEALINCYNAGTLILIVDYTNSSGDIYMGYNGGIAGRLSGDKGRVINCYNTGQVYGGFPPAASVRGVLGGIVGESGSGSKPYMVNCYSSGVVLVSAGNGANYGISAANEDGYTNCYWEEYKGATKGANTPDKTVKLSESVMKNGAAKEIKVTGGATVNKFIDALNEGTRLYNAANPSGVRASEWSWTSGAYPKFK